MWSTACAEAVAGRSRETKATRASKLDSRTPADIFPGSLADVRARHATGAIADPVRGPCPDPGSAPPYGLFALVMVFVGFCEAILLDGAVEALVTVDDLHHLHTTAANLTNGLMALVLGLVMFVWRRRSRPRCMTPTSGMSCGRWP